MVFLYYLLVKGTGKTNIALECASVLKQHTLFCVHTKELLMQAKERAESTLNCTTSLISEGKCDTSGDIVFATVQTLVKIIDKEQIRQDEFGLIIVDECFPSNTKISTPMGYKNIEDIKIGDDVYSYNHKTNEVEIKKVDYLFNKVSNDLVNIKMSNGKILTCTDNHPIYTNRGYIKSKYLKEGDIVYELQPMWERNKERYVFNQLRVENVTFQERRDIGKFKRCFEQNHVYNIGVKDNNNYFANDILVHNCHHLSSNAESVTMFEQCVNYFSARYKLGLTATLHKSNGLEITTTKILGNVIYELKKNDTKDKLIGYYEGKPIVEVPANMFQIPARIFTINTDYIVDDKDVFDVNGGNLIFTKMITDLAMNKERNEKILSLAKKIDGYTIIISERTDQLHYLNERLSNSICIDGKTPKKERERLVEEFKNGKYRILLASYSLIAEGFDVPMLENLIMASPVKDERLVIQSVGRCQRPFEGKKIANVYDFIDDVSVLHRFFSKRKSVYKKEGWEIYDGTRI